MTVEFYYHDSTDWVDVSAFVADEIRIERSTWTESRKSAVDRCVFEMYPDATLVTELTDDNLIKVRVKNGTSVRFLGIVEKNSTIVYRGGLVPSVVVNCVDNDYLLDYLIASDIDWDNYYVCNSADTANSIFHQLIYLAGYSAADISSVSNVTTQIPNFSCNAGEKTYRELMDDIMFEYLRVLYTSNDGTFFLLNWASSSHTSTATITEADCFSETFNPKTEYNDYTTAKVIWNTLGTRDDALLYRWLSGFDEYGNYTGEAVAAGDYFPPDSDVNTEYQDYNTEWLDEAYLNRLKRTKNKDLALVKATNQTVTFSADAGIVQVVNNHYPQRSQVNFRNSGAGSANIYWYEIKGDALFREKINEESLKVKTRTIASVDREKEYKYETRYIYDQTSARILTRALGAMIQAVRIYTFSSDELFTISAAVDIDVTIDGVRYYDQCRIVQRNPRYLNNGNIIIYDYVLEQAVIYGSSTPSTVVYGPQLAPTAERADLRAENAVTYPQYLDGFSSTALEGGGVAYSSTDLPAITPTAYADQTWGRAVHLELNQIQRLTGLQVQYRWQVSDDALTWYAPKPEGGANNTTDWHTTSSAGSYLTVDVNALDMSNIPLPVSSGATGDDPIAKTFYFRGAVYKDGYQSAWSAAKSRTVYPMREGDLLARAIKAEKIDTDALNARQIDVSAFANTAIEKLWLAVDWDESVNASGDTQPNLATNLNNLTWATTPAYVSGISGQALDIGTNAAYVLLTGVAPSTGAFSINCWLNVRELDTRPAADVGRAFIDSRRAASPTSYFNIQYVNDNSGTNRFAISCAATGANFFTYSGSVADTNSTAGATTVDSDYMVTLINTGSSVALYINGIQVASTSYTGWALDTDSRWRIGAQSAFSTGGWKGALDDTAIWSRALSLAEIKDLYLKRRNPLNAASGGLIKAGKLQSITKSSLGTPVTDFNLDKGIFTVIGATGDYILRINKSSSGDVEIGSPTTGTAGLIWDRSAKTLGIKGSLDIGSTTGAYINVTGPSGELLFAVNRGSSGDIEIGAYTTGSGGAIWDKSSTGFFVKGSFDGGTTGLIQLSSTNPLGTVGYFKMNAGNGGLEVSNGYGSLLFSVNSKPSFSGSFYGDGTLGGIFSPSPFVVQVSSTETSDQAYDSFSSVSNGTFPALGVIYESGSTNVYYLAYIIKDASTVKIYDTNDTEYEIYTNGSTAAIGFYGNYFVYPNTQIRGSLIPGTDNLYEIGSSSKTFKSIYTQELNAYSVVRTPVGRFSDALSAFGKSRVMVQWFSDGAGGATTKWPTISFSSTVPAFSRQDELYSFAAQICSTAGTFLSPFSYSSSSFSSIFTGHARIDGTNAYLYAYDGTQYVYASTSTGAVAAGFRFLWT